MGYYLLVRKPGKPGKLVFTLEPLMFIHEKKRKVTKKMALEKAQKLLEEGYDIILIQGKIISRVNYSDFLYHRRRK
jgi:hypothetical protein